MKNILTVLLLTIFSLTKAQSVSDYKYITVPRKFADFDKNNYKLDAHLKMHLRKKNYEIVVEGVTEKPTDLKNNPCLAAKANIESMKSTFKNKLKVVFTDCNENVISEYEGISSIKEFDKGYQEALAIAMAKAPMQNAKEVPNTVQQEQPVTTTTNTTTTITNEQPVIVSVSENKIYSLNGQKYEVATLSQGSFIFMNRETAQIVAQFYPSSQKNVYHVTVISPKGNYQTIGFVSENEISIDYQTADKTWTKTTYTK
ncbi:hypothetical protein [Chishuiella changwenlii]|uniref:hypothetical protein n=1 Tax=Chishuiella changwenlii TaxID=1434701 RepID=UPI002FDAE460